MPKVELQLLYIMEEMGEVAEAIRKSSGKKKRIEKQVNLGSEIADLFISITTLANNYGVDITLELKTFQKRMLERHSRGH